MQERPITDRAGQRSVVFLSLEGDLFFGVADELQTQLTRVVGSEVRVIILRLKRTHMIDATVLSVLDQFAANMRERDRHVLLCGVRPELHDKLRAHGLANTIGEDNILETQFGVFTSAKAALRRARDLIGQSIDIQSILDESRSESGFDEDPANNYQI
jgi:anti-anti-sigma factor